MQKCLKIWSCVRYTWRAAVVVARIGVMVAWQKVTSLVTGDAQGVPLRVFYELPGDVLVICSSGKSFMACLDCIYYRKVELSLFIFYYLKYKINRDIIWVHI